MQMRCCHVLQVLGSSDGVSDDAQAAGIRQDLDELLSRALRFYHPNSHDKPYTGFKEADQDTQHTTDQAPRGASAQTAHVAENSNPLPVDTHAQGAAVGSKRHTPVDFVSDSESTEDPELLPGQCSHTHHHAYKCSHKHAHKHAHKGSPSASM